MLICLVAFLEVEEGGQDLDKEAVKVYLIRFIADLPLLRVYRWHDGVPCTFMGGLTQPTQTRKISLSCYEQ